MKSRENLIMALICFGILVLIYSINPNIILIPYMGYAIFILFAIGGYNAGLGIGKMINNDEL